MERVVIELPYSPRPLQRAIHNSLKRFNVLVCHRRFGKTVLCINELVKQALGNDKPAPRYAYIAPLYKQAKAVAWDYLKYYTSPIPDVKANESELRVDLPNGARVQLFGADNPDALRGIYLDGVILDEYAQMSPRLWAEVIRPLLSDREGWAIFIGTPMGHNEFYDLYQAAQSREGWYTAMFKASETQIIKATELKAAREEMAEPEYMQEFECSWQAAIKGAYYGQLMAEAETGGRITRVPYDNSMPVETWWDLGMSDSTAIWFVQRSPHEFRVIDYYEMTGEGLGHYAKVLQDRGYIYSQHIAPPDIEVRELGTGKSRKEIAANLGISFTVAPKMGVGEGIDAVRRMIPRCWFDVEKCKQGIEALRQYRKDYDDKLKVFRAHPLHDWSSHAADAFRYGALSSGPAIWSKTISYDNRGII